VTAKIEGRILNALLAVNKDIGLSRSQGFSSSELLLLAVLLCSKQSSKVDDPLQYSHKRLYYYSRLLEGEGFRGFGEVRGASTLERVFITEVCTSPLR
jgi:hypothetical protein